MKKSHSINLFICVLSLLLLAILLPQDIYHGPKVVAAAFLLVVIASFSFMKFAIYILRIKEGAPENFSPVFMISSFLGAFVTGFILHINAPSNNGEQAAVYIPEYEVPVRASDCNSGYQKKRRRDLLSNEVCLIDIESVDFMIGSIIQSYSIRTSEVNCIRFDINTGELGLRYAANVISCSDIKNKLRVRAYNKSLSG